MAAIGENGGELSLALAVASLTTALNEAIKYMNSHLYNFCNSRRVVVMQSFPERGRPHLISKETWDAYTVV